MSIRHIGFFECSIVKYDTLKFYGSLVRETYDCKKILF